MENQQSNDHILFMLDKIDKRFDKLEDKIEKRITVIEEQVAENNVYARVELSKLQVKASLFGALSGSLLTVILFIINWFKGD